jgi:membrane fusion protein (multidrug efflux system)
MNRKKILTTIGGVVGLGALWAIGSWLLVGRYHISTDNAYVRADITMVAAKTENQIDAFGDLFS